MDKKRAKEIACSPIMANVTYNETPIYIEDVNDNKGTACIHSLNEPSRKQEVPINSLQER